MGAIQALDGLDKSFFKGLPKELSPGDSVELYGEEGCGKTELLIHFCAICILPKIWSSINLSGKETKVVLVDTSYKFPLWRLVQVIEQQTRNSTKSTKAISTAEMDEIVKSCLQRLFLVQCSSSLNLIKTLTYLEKLFVENPDISLLMIDSISEFYWTDRAIGGTSRYEHETHQRSIINKLTKYQNLYSLVVIVVKSAIMNQSFRIVPTSAGAGKTNSFSRNPDDYLSPEWNKFLTYKFDISKKNGCGKNNDQTWYTAILNKQPKTISCKFMITNCGIEYLSE